MFKVLRAQPSEAGLVKGGMDGGFHRSGCQKQRCRVDGVRRVKRVQEHVWRRHNHRQAPLHSHGGGGQL